MAFCSLVECLGARLRKQFLKVILDVRNIVAVSNVKYGRVSSTGNIKIACTF
jgi:hypothetical protein